MSKWDGYGQLCSDALQALMYPWKPAEAEAMETVYEFSDRYFRDSAESIEKTLETVWIVRDKLNYRGISAKKGLRYIVAGNVDQAFLEEIGELDAIERLRFEAPFVAREFSPLLKLKRLKSLQIDSPRNIADFESLLRLPALRKLDIENPKKMSDLEWLRDAHQLEVIGISGGMYSPYTIPSLAPLAGLRSLKAFIAVSTRLADEDLSPLARCSNLTLLKIARVATRDEFEKLARAKPDLLCSWFDPGMWGDERV